MESRLQGQVIHYQGEEPPEFDPDHPSAYPQHVVIEVEAHEPTGQLFSKTGFYLLPHRSPQEAETLIFPRP